MCTRRRSLACTPARTYVRTHARPAVMTAMLLRSNGGDTSSARSLAPLLICLLVLGAAGLDESGKSIRGCMCVYVYLSREGKGGNAIRRAGTRSVYIRPRTGVCGDCFTHTLTLFRYFALKSKERENGKVLRMGECCAIIFFIILHLDASAMRGILAREKVEVQDV